MENMKKLARTKTSLKVWEMIPHLTQLQNIMHYDEENKSEELYKYQSVSQDLFLGSLNH